MTNRQKNRMKDKTRCIINIYTHQKVYAIKNNVDINYTKEMFLSYFINDNDFNKIYKTSQTPTICRKNSNACFSLSNLHVITRSEFLKKRGLDEKNGINLKRSKAVNQYNKNGDLIKTYYSMAEASRQTGVKQGSISICCSGKTHTAGGFYWDLV